MNRMILALALLLPLALGHPAGAVEPDEIMADSGLETRAREISKGLRCVVCQNQSIDDSNAPIARDLRILVRERLLLGDDDEQVVDFIVARYGEYVRLKPSFRPTTYPLWLGPPIIGVLGLITLFLVFRSRQHTRPVGDIEPLSPADLRRLDALVDREIARQEQPEPNDRS